MSLKINISELETATGMLFTHLKSLGKKEVELSVDFYWNIPKENRYNPYQSPDPGQLDMGQLDDDVTEIIKIVKGEKEPIGYALVWLASIFRAIGEEVVA